MDLVRACLVGAIRLATSTPLLVGSYYYKASHPTRCHSPSLRFHSLIHSIREQLSTMPTSEHPEAPSPPLPRDTLYASYTYDNLTGWKSMRILRIGRGMYHDVRRRLPYYWSDIRDAWTYRTVASIIRMYFVKWVTLARDQTQS